MSQTWYDDHDDLEAAVATALHSADVPDLSLDLDAALHRGRRVVRRRRVAAVTAGAAAALLVGLGIVSTTTLGPGETPPASTTSVRSGTVELEVVGRSGPDGFTTPVRGRFELTSRGAEVTFSQHDGMQWLGSQRATLPPDGSADVMVLGDGAGGYLAYAVVRGEPSGVRGFAGDDEVDLVDSRSRQLPGSDLWVLVVTTDPDDVMSRVDRLTWTADGQEREVSAP